MTKKSKGLISTHSELLETINHIFRAAGNDNHILLIFLLTDRTTGHSQWRTFRGQMGQTKGFFPGEFAQILLSVFSLANGGGPFTMKIRL